MFIKYILKLIRDKAEDLSKIYNVHRESIYNKVDDVVSSSFGLSNVKSKNWSMKVFQNLIHMNDKTQFFII